ncbi:MAG: diaminopimelate decarboxylase [bacterium]|nr:diaminopimelate decarboxylase [bacterium]
MNKDVIYYPRKSVEKAVSAYETPFFLYEEKRLRENCRRFKNAFDKYFDDFWPLFAVKANPNPEILKIIIDEGFAMDASSEAEVWLCEKLGVGGMYTGNYTTAKTLAYAKDRDFILNLDDITNLEALEEIGVPETLSFRINPGVGNATMENNVFAGPDAKYGVPFEKAVSAYKKAKEMGVKKFGIHMMTGSNVPIDEKDYFALIVEKLFNIVAEVKKETGIEIEIMNIGGGFGVPYRPEENSLDMEELAQSVRVVFDEQCKKYDLKEPRLMAEPGRIIAADAGWLVGLVVVIKDSYKKFVGIDASANDMPRPSIYGAYHYVSVLKKIPGENETVSIVGSICENNDQFAKNRQLPKCEVGDIVLIHNSGGHAFSMGHNYNGKPRHAEYLIADNGEIRQIRRAETIEDLYKTVKL